MPAVVVVAVLAVVVVLVPLLQDVEVLQVFEVRAVAFWLQKVFSLLNLHISDSADQ